MRDKRPFSRTRTRAGYKKMRDCFLWPPETHRTDCSQYSQAALAGRLYETVRRRWMWPPGVHRGSGRNPLEAILVDRATGAGPCKRRSRRTGSTVDHYRTTKNRKVAFGTEPVDQILSVNFNDSGPLQALFYGLQELQESAPALC